MRTSHRDIRKRILEEKSKISTISNDPTNETPETAASLTEETMTESIMPIKTARIC